MIPCDIVTSATQTSDAWQLPVTIWAGRTVIDATGLPLGYGAKYTVSIGTNRAWDDQCGNRYPVLTILPYRWFEWDDWRMAAPKH